MSQPRVYLAGPITGLTHDGATDWRDDFARDLDPRLVCYSPMRGKDYLRTAGVLQDDYQQHLLSTGDAILTRDHHDVTHANAVVANLLAPPRVSIGTVMEIAWAYDRRIPIILVLEPEGNPHDHAMIRSAVRYGFRVPDLATARSVLEHLLLPGPREC